MKYKNKTRHKNMLSSDNTLNTTIKQSLQKSCKTNG